MISKHVMFQIIDKFLNVAVSDSDIDIRCTILESLNENFDYFLNSQPNLLKLVFCCNSVIVDVQERALKILCRLSKLKPSAIVDYLKSKIYSYIECLSMKQQDKSQLGHMQLLKCLITYGGHIIEPYIKQLMKVLF